MLPNIIPHPMLANLNSTSASLLLSVSVADTSVTPSSDVTFGLAGTYPYHPREIVATVAGNLVYQLVGDSAIEGTAVDKTIALDAGQSVTGWFAKIDDTSTAGPFIVRW